MSQHVARADTRGIMTLKTDVENQVTDIFKAAWETSKSSVVPEDDDLKLGNAAINLEAAVLYADLVDSTALVDQYKAPFAAEIYKTYLGAASRIIRARDGAITAFDGDRVMAVFVGKSKNSQAAKAALQINWAVSKIINPSIKKQYPDTSFQLSHVVGIDVGPLFVARTGIRGSNDLVWVGSAANYAAKLCAFRQAGYKTLITERVHSKLNETSKLGGSPKRGMWKKLSWTAEAITIYGSSWHWELD